MGRKSYLNLLIVYLICLAFVVFTPNDGKANNGFLWFLNVSSFFHDILNFLLLTPLPLLIDRVNSRFNSAYLLTIGSLISAIIEVTQRWIPGRDPSWLDFAFNSAGSLLVSLYRVRMKSHKSTPHRA